MAELRAASTARRERLQIARERERKARGQGTMGAFRVNGKRAKIQGDEGSVSGSGSGEAGDDQFLPDDKEPEEGDGVYLSSEVRELMAKYALTDVPSGTSRCSADRLDTRHLVLKWPRAKKERRTSPRSVEVDREKCSIPADNLDLLYIPNPHTTTSTNFRTSQN